MTVPLDAIRAIHNGFRKDIAAMDAAAYAAAAGQGALDRVLEHYVLFNDILIWHAAGEEDSVFPALEKVAPLVAEAYERDHRGLDALSESLRKAVSASDPLAIARATAAFEFHLRMHLDKEEAHLYRIFNDRIPLPEHGPIVMKMAQKVPRERFPELVGWLMPLVGPDDREHMTRIWQIGLPAPVFAGIARLIQATIGDDWAELTRRIPELNSPQA